MKHRPCGLVALALALSGCALHLRAPEPDLGRLQPVAPAAETSHVAAVVRMPYPALAGLLEHRTVAPVQHEQRLGFVAWQVAVQREGKVTARAQDDRLCFLVPFRGHGTVMAAGQKMQRALVARVDVCAVPRLDERGAVRLQDPAVRVELDRLELGGTAKGLFDALAVRLEQAAGAEIAAYLRELAVPTTDALAPLLTALQAPIPLPQGACLLLRPQVVHLAQPGVDPSALRLALSVQALPTVEQPCSGQRAAGKAPAVQVAADLRHPETKLLLPVGVGLESLRDQLLADLRRRGRIRLDDGHVEVTGLRLDSARGALLVRAAVRGRVRDTFLGIPYTRDIDGELLLWGVPAMDAQTVYLRDVQLDLQTDDTLASLGAALKRARLTEAVADKLRLPRREVELRARQAIDGLAQGVHLGDQQLPVRIDTKELGLQHVQARGGRLEVLVRFVGQIVVGDTGRR